MVEHARMQLQVQPVSLGSGCVYACVSARNLYKVPRRPGGVKIDWTSLSGSRVSPCEVGRHSGCHMFGWCSQPAR